MPSVETRTSQGVTPTWDDVEREYSWFSPAAAARQLGALTRLDKAVEVVTASQDRLTSGDHPIAVWYVAHSETYGAQSTYNMNPDVHSVERDAQLASLQTAVSGLRTVAFPAKAD
jgi:hypothetical protein